MWNNTPGASLIHSAIFGCKGTQKKLLALAHQALVSFLATCFTNSKIKAYCKL